MNSRYLAFAVFGLLAILLFLTWSYEKGSDSYVCRAWGSFLTASGEQWSRGSGMGGGMHAMHDRHMGGYGFRGFGLAFWVLVAVFIYLLFNRRRKKSSAVEHLNARLARGEITPEEYLEAKRLLEER